MKFNCALFLVFVCLASTAAAQDEPYSQAYDAVGHPQLRGILEDDFTGMLENCMQWPTGRVHLTLEKTGKFGSTSTKEVTSIPRDILSEVKALNYVKSPTDASLGALFTYIFTQADKDSDSEKTPVGDRLLNFSLPQDISYLLDTRYSGTVYGQTCASSISGKLQVAGGYSLPVADVQASIDASASKSASWSLDLIDGTFNSPLPELLDNLDVGVAPYTQLLIWKWYRDEFASHPDVVSTKNYLLRRLHGIAIYKVYGDKEYFTMQAGANASLNAVFVKASGQVNADSNATANTKINVYQVMPYVDQSTGKGDKDWSLLPPPATLASEHFQTALQESALNSIVQPYSIHIEHNIATAIPRDICTKSLWDAYAPDGSTIPSLILSSVSVAPTAKSTDQSVPCIFETHYNVPGTIPSAGIPLNYGFAMKIDPAKPASGANAFVLTAPGVVLTTADGPNLSVGLINPGFNSSPFGAGSTKLDWNIVLQVAETPTAQIGSGTTVSITNLGLSCGGSIILGAITVTPLAVAPTIIGGAKELQFTVSKVVLDSDVNSAAKTGLIKCHLTGTATFTLSAGGNVSRPLSTGQGIEILFPPAPPPSAPSGVAFTASTNQVTLTWSAVSGATSFNVYKSTASGSRTGVPYRSGITGTSFTDTGLTTGYQLYYVITAVSTSGEGAPSSEVLAHQ